MSLTLGQVKDRLRITNTREDALIERLIASARAAIAKYTGDNFDDQREDLNFAQLLLIEYWRKPDEKVKIDEENGFPVAVSALAKPYRVPTLS